jgi:hypothetical protein
MVTALVASVLIQRSASMSPRRTIFQWKKALWTMANDRRLRRRTRSYRRDQQLQRCLHLERKMERKIRKM